MKAIYLLILLSAVVLTVQNTKTKNYWDDAPVNGMRIYSICFVDDDNGYAVTADNNFFITSDAGYSWEFTRNIADLLRPGGNKVFWSAEIYCSVMQTKDNGTTWYPYTREKQDHFCCVYLKDPNTGYKIAEEFLQDVSRKIFSGIDNKDIGSLTDHPQQCAEYYSKKDEGWALGWCVKEFRSSDKLAVN